MICLDKDLKLKQSNNLILATHRMNIQQMRLFFYACSQYQGDLDIEVSIDDINRILAYQGGNQREIIKNAIPTLMQSALVHIEDENGERWSIAITDSYIKNDNKTVKFTFNKTVQKELEELRGYTWLYLSNLTGMSSTYAVRIYEFFAMRLGSQNKKDTFDFDLNKLRIYLDCTNKLEDFRNFSWKNKTDVIDVKTKVQQEPINNAEQIELEEFLKEFE